MVVKVTMYQLQLIFCLPIRAGFGGLDRNSAGFYLSGFSGFVLTSTDILFVELTAIHRGLLLVVEMGIEELVCYSDSLLSISLITGHASNLHVYSVLIQDIKRPLVLKKLHHSSLSPWRKSMYWLHGKDWGQLQSLLMLLLRSISSLWLEATQWELSSLELRLFFSFFIPVSVVFFQLAL